MKKPPEMVLFDCDGVLVDSESLTADVLISNLGRHGLMITHNQLSDFFLGGTIMGVAAKARELGADLPANWIDDIYEEIFDVLGREVEPIPGVDAVLDSLDAAGIAYAVGSNGPRRKMEITLTRCGLADRLRGRVYSRQDVANPKPAPDVYLKAAKDAGIAPAQCVVIEDSPNGARAGIAAGMVTFGFAAETDPSRLQPICDLVFNDMADLPGLLGL